MHIEDIQNNFDRQRKSLTKRYKTSDINPDDLENLDALETVVNSKLGSIDNRLANFLSGNPIPDTQNLAEEFEHLRSLRHKVEIELMDLIDGFGNEGLIRIRETVGKNERTVERRTLEISGEKRKDDLKYKVVLFSFLHNLSDDLLQGMSKTSKSKNIKTENRKNERNINLAQMQQYLAMSIIRNSRENYPLFNDSVSKFKKIYNFPDQQNASLEGGVIGLVGAYHHYRKQGYKVLFATPEVDASMQTDMYIVRWGRLIPEEKEKLSQEGIEKINNLPLDIRNQVSKVQVKCHMNEDKPTRDIIFDLATNNAYKDEADFNQGSALYTISDYDYRPDEEYLFFKNQCSGLTNGRFLDMKMSDAKSYLKEDQQKK